MKERNFRCQASLLAFIEQVSTEPPPAKHHKLIIEKLEAVERGEIRRLMIFAPPGSAKSHYASVMFPSWYLGRNPKHNIIAASYGQELADKFGRRVRGVVQEPLWQEIFDNRLSSVSQAANRWALDSGAEYFGVGVGGPIAGYRSDVGIIDDPTKNREEADSETTRNKTKEWYRSDFWPRLKPGARVIIIQTRWHEDDLSGWLLDEAKKGGEPWEVLSLPAIAEDNDPLGRVPGDMLWPEWFTPEMFAEARRDLRNWTALYQQRPAPEEGDFFKRDWIRWYEGKPPGVLKYYGASDYAVTEKGGDYTVHLVVGVDPNDDIYLIDLWRDQTDSLVWVNTLVELIKLYKPLEWGEESGQITRGLGPLIDKRQREEKAYCYRKQFPSSSDKPTRAQAFRGRMAQGKVFFPKHKPWIDKLIPEILQFPTGKNDDQVDALSLIGRMLGEMVRGKETPKPNPIRLIPTINELIRESARKRNREKDDDRI